MIKTQLDKSSYSSADYSLSTFNQECTSLAEKIKTLGVKVSRIGYGLPVGADIEYADELTLTRALEGRREL